jgi:hypothetical protein
MQHAIWLTSAADLVKMSMNLRHADTASAAVLTDPRLMLDTLKLAQNAQRSLSREVSALQPKACRIRKAPGMQVCVTTIAWCQLQHIRVSSGT